MSDMIEEASDLKDGAAVQGDFSGNRDNASFAQSKLYLCEMTGDT